MESLILGNMGSGRTKQKDNVKKCHILIASFNRGNIGEFQKEILKCFSSRFNKAVFQCTDTIDWHGLDPRGQISYLLKNLEEGTPEDSNPFDVLSTCFSLGLCQQKLTCNQVIQTYQTLEEGLGERHEICMGMGNAYFNSKQYAKAQKQFLRARHLRDTAKAWESLTITTHHLSMRKSLEYAAEWEKRDNNNPLAKVWASRCRMELNELERLVELRPQYLSLYLELAQDQQNQAKKEFILRKLLKCNPDYIEAHIELTRMMEKPWNKIALKGLLEKYPNCSNVHAQLGKNYTQNLTNIQYILRHLQKAEKCNPNNFQVYFVFGEVLEAQGSQDIALGYYEQTLELNPYHEQAIKKVFQINKIRKDKTDQLQKWSKKIEEMNLFCPCYLKSLGLCYAINGKYVAAIDSLLKYYEIDPHDPDIDFLLTNCYRKLGNREQTIKWSFRCVKKRNNNQKKAYNSALLLLVDLVDFQGIVEWYLQYANILSDQQTVSPSFVDSVMEKIQFTFISKVHPETVLQSLQQVAGRLLIIFQNRIKFLIVGKMFVILEQSSESAKYFDILKLITKDRCSRVIKFELQMYYGDIQNGILSFQQKVSRKTLQSHLEHQFEVVYQEQIPPYCD